MKNKLFGIAALALCLGFSSCNNDDDLQFSKEQVTNSDLKAVLEKKGLHFDNEGHLLLDGVAMNTTTLDLSGMKIDDYKALSALPNLVELKLSNIECGPKFDFSILPEQIKAVDLTKNEIYEFANLVDIKTEENGDETVTLIRDFSKLYLPESAKHNCNEVVAYYNTDKEVDMKLGDAPYTTLREVPDEQIRNRLKESFPSLFDKEDPSKINLNNRIVNAEEAQATILLAANSYGDPLNGVKSLEGVQYVIMNKGYMGVGFFGVFDKADKLVLPYMQIRPTICQIRLENVSTPKLDFSNAKKLHLLYLINNDGIESLDLSASTILGQRTYEEESKAIDELDPCQISLANCRNLKKVKFPEKAKIMHSLGFINTNAIEEINLSQFSFIFSLNIVGDIKCGIKYLEYENHPGELLFFGVSEKVFAKPETQEFCRKYKDLLSENSPEEELSGLPHFPWKSHIK